MWQFSFMKYRHLCSLQARKPMLLYSLTSLGSAFQRCFNFILKLTVTKVDRRGCVLVVCSWAKFPFQIFQFNGSFMCSRDGIGPGKPGFGLNQARNSTFGPVRRPRRSSYALVCLHLVCTSKDNSDSKRHHLSKRRFCYQQLSHRILTMHAIWLSISVKHF